MKTRLTKEHWPEMEIRGCRDCLYFETKPPTCICGFDHCILFPPKKVISKGPCTGCPYGRREPCVGICMKNLMAEWREERKGVSVYA